MGISQSPQNGWETWFSCTWGQNVAKLQAPCDRQKPRKVARVLQTARKEAQAAADSLAKAGTSASFAKYALGRHGLAAYTKERLVHLERLSSMVSAGDSGGGADENSKVLMEIMMVDLRVAFSVFDRNGDGVVDQSELASILSRGNGLHVFAPQTAKKIADDIARYFGDGEKLTVDQFLEWWKKVRSGQIFFAWFVRHTRRALPPPLFFCT